MPNPNVIDGLRALGFRAAPETLASLMTLVTKSRLGPTETLEQLIALEHRERDTRNLQSRTKQATIGAVKAIDQFDWAFPRKIDRALYEQLLALDFVDRGENVLFRGPSGVGKTMLAQNLGLAALTHGYTVRFTTLAAALADLLKQESLPAIERRLRHYVAPSLLVCDEIGYLPCDNRSADLLYNIVSRRHEQRSMIISTNLAYKLWGTIFPGAACVVALVDRFSQHCHVLDIDGDSWRQKNDGLAATTKPPTKPARKKR